VGRTCAGLGLLLALASCVEVPPEAPHASPEAPRAPAAATAEAAPDAKKPAAVAQTAAPREGDISSVLAGALSVVDVAGAALRSGTDIRPVLERWIAENGPPRASVLRARASELPPKLQQAGSALADDIDALVGKVQTGATYDSEAAKAYGDASSFPSDPQPGATLRPVGGMSPLAIQLIVRNKFGAMRSCYERGLAAQHDLHGKVLTRFVIEKNGDVSTVEDGGSDLPDPKVTECVRAAFRTLRFGPRRGNLHELEVVYPIIFNPGD
jgi:hypothetical protein